MDPDLTVPFALYGVGRTLEIEHERRADETPDGFTWWIAPGLHQRVEVEPSTGAGARWLRVTTPLWRGADLGALAPLLADLRQHARGAAVRVDPGTGDVALVTRAALEDGRRALPSGSALASAAGVQAFLGAWAWGEAAKRVGDRARAWRAVRPHPARGMDVAPSPVLQLRERMLAPRLEAQGEPFRQALFGEAVARIERDGLGYRTTREPDGFKVAFVVDVGPTFATLEVALMRGPADHTSLAAALTLPGHLDEARAHAACIELLERQLAPGALTWTLGSWMPMPRRDGRPGFGLTHGLFFPLATAYPGMGHALGRAAGPAVGLLRAWLEEGAGVGGGRMVA